MGFRGLRVINEDRVQPGRGFGTHGHRDMEIVSYVLAGELGHQDSMGNGSVIRPGDVQRMSAGTGVRHSEANPSTTNPVHFLQIWIEPATLGATPGYAQQHVDVAARSGQLRLIVSPDGRDGSVTIGADAAIYAGVLGEGQRAELALAPGRHAWVHLARGTAEVNGVSMVEGDGLALSGEAAVRVVGEHAAEVLVFDLA